MLKGWDKELKLLLHLSFKNLVALIQKNLVPFHLKNLATFSLKKSSGALSFKNLATFSLWKSSGALSFKNQVSLSFKVPVILSFKDMMVLLLKKIFMVFSHLKIWWVSKKNSSALSCKEPVAAPSFKKKKNWWLSHSKKILVLSHLKKSCGFLTQKKIWCSLI